MNKPTSWLNPKAVGILAQDGHRLVRTVHPLQRGELVAVFGGDIVTSDALHELSDFERRHTLQVDEDHYLVSTSDGPADWINHSCAPNLGFSGQLTLVTLRRIEAGEELTFDYAMSDGSAYDEFACCCGASECRGGVSGEDWRNEHLWDRYGNFFSPYLQRRIMQLHKARASAGGSRRASSRLRVRAPRR
jgi:hypothetical protein